MCMECDTLLTQIGQLKSRKKVIVNFSKAKTKKIMNQRNIDFSILAKDQKEVKILFHGHIEQMLKNRHVNS